MIVVDASALVAIICAEPEGASLLTAIDTEADSSEFRMALEISIWEAACAISRIKRISRPHALLEVENFLRDASISRAAADKNITQIAIDAAERYGAGNIQGNPAVLNLGDCFSYATARYYGAKLVCKGEDFPRTDIQIA